jgi:hypothetical protein
MARSLRTLDASSQRGSAPQREPEFASYADRERIAQRAYERFEERGRQDGRDLDDWLEAERELSGMSANATGGEQNDDNSGDAA